MNKLAVFLDADVIFAGTAAPTEHSASNIVLELGEVRLIDCITSVQVVTELERNFEKKLPGKLPELRLVISRSHPVVSDLKPEELVPYKGQADSTDLPILVSALKYGCRFLLTFNTRHYKPATEAISIQRPGEFVRSLRIFLAHMATGRD